MLNIEHTKPYYGVQPLMVVNGWVLWNQIFSVEFSFGCICCNLTRIPMHRIIKLAVAIENYEGIDPWQVKMVTLLSYNVHCQP